MTVLRGDCVEVMAGMEPDSVDAICTDPPYGLSFMGKDWDRLDGAQSKPGIGKRHTEWVGLGDDFAGYNPTCAACGGRARGARKCACASPDWRIRGVKPDTAQAAPEQAFHHRWATAALRVAKPGAYLLAFGGTRTVHRMTSALEDAGWVIRDMLVWAYAQGFPKSKASLKPAWEPIVMARKPGPLRDLNIDAARIHTGEPIWTHHGKQVYGGNFTDPYQSGDARKEVVGRWPANVILTDPILDGGWDGVVGGGENSVPPPGKWREDHKATALFSKMSGTQAYMDKGTYSRYFLIPKAPTRERVLSDGRRSPHPTQKPEALIRHLVRLVTPDGGMVLDPFLGSGTLGVVCDGLGIRWQGIEREPEYADWAEDRINDSKPLWEVA